MKCLICNKSEKVKFLDSLKLEVKEDEKYFPNAKIYRCDDCDFAFVSPIPNEETLNYFYKNIYRSNNRPPYLLSENYEDQKKHYLEDKNLSYILYLTSLIDVKRVKNLYDFGCGDGDLGFALKIKFPQLNLYCTEGDSHCERILNDRSYINFKNLNMINKKFELIITTHALPHLSDINSIFSKFNDILNPNGYIFIETPNCSKKYWEGRHSDGPLLQFHTKKSIEKLAEKHNFELINFSFSAYSFSDDHKYQKESLDLYDRRQSSIFTIQNLKKIIKKFIPKKLISLRQDFNQIKQIRSITRMNWFVNNTGDNCYIRAVLKKKNTV